MEDAQRVSDSSVVSDMPSNSSLADKNAIDSGPQDLLFPIEIWERIVLYMLPEIRPEEHIHPQPNGEHLQDRAVFRPKHQQALKALALTCKRLRDIALPALFYAPFIRDHRAVNKFVERICQNNCGRLVPQSSEVAGMIRALHLQSQMCCIQSVRETFCTCDLHILFSLAGNVRYLSLDSMDCRRCDYCRESYNSYYEDGAENHVLVHFLSRTTTCRPLGLRWINNSSSKSRLSLQEATSYEPLSQLTSLELLHVTPPPELIAFLTGDSQSAARFPEVQEAISAGLSPNQRLERLRLTTMTEHFMFCFNHYGAEIPVEDLMDVLDRRGMYVIDEEIGIVQQLHKLASKSWMLPNLRLLILEMPCRSGLQSEEVLEGLVDRNVLPDLSSSFPKDEPMYPKWASSKLSSLFHASRRLGKMVDSPNSFHGINVSSSDVDSTWQNSIAKQDSYWRSVHSGKQLLTQLWNRPRLERGLEETEIRIVLQRQPLSGKETYTNLDESFFCQAQSIARVGTTSKKCALQSSIYDGLTMDDDGVWADPDIFSLVDTMPWLSYHQYNQYGCCCWSGELPRDNNPTSSSDGITPRVVLPALIKMDEKQLDELGRLRRNPSRRARKSTDEQETESKRQRSSTVRRTQAATSFGCGSHGH